MANYEEPISSTEKLRIASDFIKHAPPGEFNEVFNDVRILLNDDRLLKEEAACAFAEYNMEQFTPCKLEGADDLVLITKHGLLNDATYFDPATRQKFRYDHLRKEANDLDAIDISSEVEIWRSLVDSALREYVKSHYPAGAMTVYGKSCGAEITITICIEDHQFQPQNFWNGRWRSEWSLVFDSATREPAPLKGIFKVQVHYYEDGNVQLVSNKEVDKEVSVDEKKLGASLLKLIEDAETDYQRAIGDNYQTMSDTTFKALRRQLPITRTKVDWNKLISYRVGQELGN